jgi:NADH-quinone oxidoreductase subunit C
MVTSLVRAEEAFTNDELVAWLRRRLEDAVLDVVDEFETLTVVITTGAWVEAHRTLKEESRLAFTMFDSLFGVDAKDEGFDVVSILYSVEMGRRILLRCRADGGRDEPTVPTLTGLYRGADFHERETWDMFGIVAEGHGSLAPRLLCDENFEGWPLRKDFHLATREAKPWPGVKEPAETDEDGNIIERVPGIGEAVGPMPLDEIMAEQAKAANADLLKDEAEAVEAEVLAEKAALRDGADEVPADELKVADEDSTESLKVADEGSSESLKVADDVRAEAAQARADKAAEIAEDGPVSGTGEGDAVPQGNPNAFETDDEDDL